MESGQKKTGFRYTILAAVFINVVINYMDRQNLSILARTIQNDLHISDIQYSYVVQAFLLAYTLTYIVAGRLTDWLGTRWSMAAFVGWWSISDMLTSLSRSAFSLGSFRFLLGIGEPGNYTAAPKAVSEWFPPKERGLIIGLYTAGATMGATLAPPLVAFLAGTVGWRVSQARAKGRRFRDGGRRRADHARRAESLRARRDRADERRLDSDRRYRRRVVPHRQAAR